MKKAPAPLEGQESFLAAPPPKAKDWKPPDPKRGRTRVPVKDRAGTVIDHKTCRVIRGTAQQGKKVHGIIDLRTQVYQSGGELGNFVYWKKGVVSLAMDCWDQIWQQSAWIEIIDHDRNEVWRIETKEAAKHGERYDAGIGPRWGIPIKYWVVCDKEWNCRPAPQ